MRKLGLVAALAIGVLLPVGCGSSGGWLEQFIQELRGCTADGLGNLIGLTLLMDPIIDAIEFGDFEPGLTVDETDEENNIWAFEYMVDLDGDGLADTTLSGTIDFSADPSEGIPAGTTSVIVFGVSGTEDYSGTGQFDSVYGAGEVTSISGFGMLTIPGGCEVEFDVPANSPLTFARNGIVPATDVFGGELYGVISLYVDTGEHYIEATLTMTMGSNTIEASNVFVDDVEGSAFDFDLELDEERFQTLIECTFASFFGIEQVVTDLSSILRAVALGEQFEGTIDTTIINVLPPAWSFTASIDGAEVTGTIALAAIPAPNGPVTATVTFDYDFPGEGFTASATAGNPLVVSGTLSEDGMAIEDMVLHGRINTRFAGPILTQLGDDDACVGTITIPSTNPINADYFNSESQGDVNLGAIVLLSVTVGSDNLKLSLAAVDREGEVELSPIGALFNNIPFPFSLIEA